MAESTQHLLDRNRPPRVHITYDVETGGAVEKIELPFVVGIMSDLAGSATKDLPKVKDRKFVSIDRDTFNDVMGAIKPALDFKVPNRLSDDPDKQLSVSLKFNTMEDFEPVRIVEQVEELRALFEARKRLSDLVAKLDGNDRLDELLLDIADNTDKLKELKETIGGNGDGQEH